MKPGTMDQQTPATTPADAESTRNRVNDSNASRARHVHPHILHTMLASRLCRCARLPPLPVPSATSRAFQKPFHLTVARQLRNYTSNNPFGGRSRYVRFGASGPESQGQGKGNPWDWRHWDRQTRIVAGVGVFAVIYYVSQYVCVFPLPYSAFVRTRAG